MGDFTSLSYEFQDRRKKKFKWRRGTIHVLIDENLPDSLCKKFPDTYHCTRIGHPGVVPNGTDDLGVWRWAEKNDVDIILTCDVACRAPRRVAGQGKRSKKEYDLLWLARDAASRKLNAWVRIENELGQPYEGFLPADQPLVIHFKNDNTIKNTIPDLVLSVEDTVRKHLDQRLSASLHIGYRNPGLEEVCGHVSINDRFVCPSGIPLTRVQSDAVEIFNRLNKSDLPVVARFRELRRLEHLVEQYRGPSVGIESRKTRPEIVQISQGQWMFNQG